MIGTVGCTLCQDHCPPATPSRFLREARGAQSATSRLCWIARGVTAACHAAQLQEDCALPFGFTLQPFGEHPHVALHQAPLVTLADLPRCTECGAYLNCFNQVDMIGFRCGLCGTYTEWAQRHAGKYNRPQARDKQVELVRQVYEVACPDYDDEVVQEGYQSMSGPYPAPKKGRPVFVVIVDIAAQADFLELAQLALAATLGALPANALVGVITVSDCIGLWDVKGGLTTVRNVPIFPTGEVMCLLEDVLPLRALLAPLDETMDNLITAFEMLQPCASGLFGFGSAIHAILDYLSGSGVAAAEGSTQGSTRATALRHSAEATVALGPCKVACFLATAPNTGIGTTGGPPPVPASPCNPNRPFLARPVAAAEISVATVSFYEQIGAIAANNGVCIDLFAVGLQSLGLSALAPLCRKSGGACFFYPTVEGSALPQDVVKRVRTPQAMSALLRIRTCPELRVAKVYGKVHADPDHEQIWHIVATDPHDSFAVSLELASVHGFLSRSGERTPQPGVQKLPQPRIQLAQSNRKYAQPDQPADPQGAATPAPQTSLSSSSSTASASQIAFQYSLLTHRKPTNEGEEVSAINGKIYRLQRRLRVLTVAPSVAKTHDALYAGAQLESVVCMLTQKVLVRSFHDSAADARMLLQSWLVIFLARWHHFSRKLPFGIPPQPGHIDIHLERLPALATITRVIYALLRCSLLSSSAATSDVSTSLRLLWSNLGPDPLLRAIHPVLVSFDDPEDAKHSRVPLSRAALRSGEGNVLLMDAFHLILVMYRASAVLELPFPPPAASELRSLIGKLVNLRGIAPEVVFCKEGEHVTRRLEELLIDDPSIEAGLDDDAAMQAAQLGFSGWMSYIESQVVQALSGSAD